MAECFSCGLPAPDGMAGHPKAAECIAALKDERAVLLDLALAELAARERHRDGTLCRCDPCSSGGS